MAAGAGGGVAGAGSVGSGSAPPSGVVAGGGTPGVDSSSARAEPTAIAHAITQMTWSRGPGMANLLAKRLTNPPPSVNSRTIRPSAAGILRCRSRPIDILGDAAQGGPCHLAGRSLRASCPPVARRKPRSATGTEPRSGLVGCARFPTPLDWHGPPLAVHRLRNPLADSSERTSRATPRTNTAARRCGRRAEARPARRGQGWPGGAEVSASSREARGTLAAPPPRQGCRGHGCPCSREISSPRRDTDLGSSGCAPRRVGAPRIRAPDAAAGAWPRPAPAPA